MTEIVFTRRMMLAGATAGILLPGTGFGQSNETPTEGGIGGTGIVGLLTEFGSLIVSGNYVETTSGTRFSDGFGPIRERDLMLGDGLTVEATGPRGALVAARVHVTHPLVGRIQSVFDGGRALQVNGVLVQLERPARGLSVGTFVAVSGLWRGDAVAASVVRPSDAPRDLVSGDVARSDEFNVMRVGGAKVRGPGVGSLKPGTFATVTGQFDSSTGVLMASGVVAGRFFGAAGPLKRLSIEGYLDPISTAPGYRVSGLGHSLQRNLKLDAYRGKRVLLNGGYTGRFAAQNATVLPESAVQRTRVLGRLSRS